MRGVHDVCKTLDTKPRKIRHPTTYKLAIIKAYCAYLFQTDVGMNLIISVGVLATLTLIFLLLSLKTV